MKYSKFIKTKEQQSISTGFEPGGLNKHLKKFQRHIVKWACVRGRSAIFADTGLGKTLMQLSWALQVEEKTNKPILILAPLCVAQQTVREGEKFGIEAVYIREPQFTNPRIHVTNYEMLKNFNPNKYGGIVLDESSILKGINGKTSKLDTDFSRNIEYELS